MQKIIFSSFCVAVAMFFQAPSMGAVIGVSGNIVLESSPYPSSSDDVIFVFDEQQGIEYSELQSLDFGSIAEGTLVNSHYVQFDPTSPTGLVTGGTIIFDGPIIGVIVSTEFLNQDLGALGTSDSFFGLADSLGAYATGDDPDARGLGSPEDDLTIVLGSNMLFIESLQIPSGAGGNLDGFRVLTAATPVPIPGALLMFSGALLGSFSFFGKRSRHKTK